MLSWILDLDTTSFVSLPEFVKYRAFTHNHPARFVPYIEEQFFPIRSLANDVFLPTLSRVPPPHPP